MSAVECLDENSEFVVYGFYLNESIVVTPDTGSACLFVHGSMLTCLKKSFRHCYVLWKAPLIETTLPTVSVVVSNNQTVTFMNYSTQITGWVRGLNGTLKLKTSSENSDPRWHGHPVFENNAILGMINFVDFHSSPLITPMDVILVDTVPFVWMDPAVELNYNDRFTSFNFNVKYNVNFRYCDIMAEKGVPFCMSNSNGEEIYVTDKPSMSTSVYYKFTPLFMFNKSIFFENIHGQIQCAYRSNHAKFQEILPSRSAWLVFVNEVDCSSFEQLESFISTTQQTTLYLVWSDGTRERADLSTPIPHKALWKKYIKSKIKVDPCIY